MRSSSSLKILTLITGGVLAASCSKLSKAPGSVGLSSTIAPDRVNIRNFDQMNETMSALTGVSTAAVADKYNKDASGAGLRANLPAGNSIKEFSGAQQGAIIQLATQYCGKMSDGLMANSYQKLKANYSFYSDFSNNMATDMTDEKVMALASKFYNDFWGACTNRPSLADTQVEILSLISDLKTQLANDATNNKPSNYFRIVCSVFLSSSCVSLF